MVWHLKWGSSLKALKIRERQTGVKPGPLLSLPKLKEHDHGYLDFYYTLDSSRSMGMSAPNPISLADVVALCSLRGIASIDDKSKYLRTVQRLDLAYRDFWAEKNKAK